MTQQRHSIKFNFPLADRNLYCSSRLGKNSSKVDMYEMPSSSSIPYVAGEKYYELSNHLGNFNDTWVWFDKTLSGINPDRIASRESGVLAVINDIKFPIEDNGSIEYFEVHLVSISDYSPFGVQLDGRTVSNGDYRYGFQGQEKDDEIKGSGNSYDFGARMYDPRLGRWLSLDAYFKDYPSTSNYTFVRNSPTIRIDPDGNTDFYFNGRYIGTDGEENGLIGLVKSKDVKKDIKKGRYKFPKKQLSQGEYNDFIVIDYNILETSNKILKKSISEGQKKEFGAVMKKDEESGKFEISENGIVEGPEVEWDSGKTGSVDFEDFEDGDITIHSHRTGQSKKTGNVASSDHPSKADQNNVEYQPLQIIVGKKGDAVIRPGGIIEDNRTNSIEFYKEDPAKSSYSLSDNQANKILKDQNERQTK